MNFWEETVSNFTIRVFFLRLTDRVVKFVLVIYKVIVVGLAAIFIIKLKYSLL